MKPHEITRLGTDLEDFVAEVFASLVRRDQRATSGLYLQGLMLDGRRKSMQPMAMRLGVDHQRLQQFVSTSAWPEYSLYWGPPVACPGAGRLRTGS